MEPIYIRIRNHFSQTPLSQTILSGISPYPHSTKTFICQAFYPYIFNENHSHLDQNLIKTNRNISKHVKKCGKTLHVRNVCIYYSVLSYTREYQAYFVIPWLCQPFGGSCI